MIPIQTARRGMTSVLAMLYLVLFSTLAIGFYAATTTASHVTNNDERVARAFLATESGMDFMRYQLANVSVPPNTPPEQVIDQLYSDLQSDLNGTPNLAGFSIARDGNIIRIPGDGNASIKLDASGASTFRATITDWAGEIVVKADGSYGGTETASRSITMDFTRQQNTTTAFDYAVASKGQIVVKKGAVTSSAGVDPKIATMMSASASEGAVTVTGGTVGGDLNIVEDGTATVTGGTVGGSSTIAAILSNHVHEVEPPEFPTIDPTLYKTYASNAFVNNAQTQKNIRVPAGTNPKFNANDTVQGIMYIESPNQVIFNGNFNLQGFIVMEEGVSTTDSLTFKGNLTMSPLPGDAQFDALRATSGVAVLAPNASMSMTGSSGGSVKGNLIVKTFDFQGASDLLVDQGTLMTLDPGANSAVFNGSKSVKFSATGASNQPKLGVSYSTYFAPKPATYQEVAP
jgi:hypothetical protein